MQLIETHIKPVLIIAGLTTSSLVMQAFQPISAVETNYGQTLADGLPATLASQEAVVIVAIGVLLLAAAWRPHLRVAAATMAIGTKAIFIIRTLMDSDTTGEQIRLAAYFDAIVVVALLWYLVATLLPSKSE